MSTQNSKITEQRANSILSDIFASGNKIALSTTDPNSKFTEPSASTYTRYEIKSGDFTASEGAITNAQHLLYGLCDDAAGWGEIVAFGIYSGTTLIYWGMLEEPKTVTYNTVPVFKKFNESAGEGIRVTLDVVSASTVSS